MLGGGVINWGYLTQQGIACAIASTIAMAFFFALRAVPALHRRPVLRLWLELPVIATVLWLLAFNGRRWGWLHWLTCCGPDI